MSDLRPRIAGSLTDAIGKAGGEELYQQLTTFLAGRPLDQTLYALTASLGSVALMVAETPEHGDAFLHTVADDAANEMRLNWEQQARFRAEATRQVSGEIN